MNGLTVTTHELGVRYGATIALQEIGLEWGAGRIHGLLGRNGAGKTTLLSTLASLRRPDAGTLELDGADPFEDEALMEQVCLIRESGDVLDEEKVRANLTFQEQARPTFDRAYAEQLLDASGIPLKRKPSSLSRGQRSALGAAIGLASRAPLTMFDEVHLGMDAPSRQRFYDALLKDFAEHPRTIVLSSHLINEIEHLLETVTILHDGRLMLSAEADEVRTRGLTVTGRADLVTQATQGLTVIGTRELGPTLQATVYGPTDPTWTQQAQAAGLQLGAVPLQDLFIHLTDSPTGAGAPGAGAATSATVTTHTHEDAR